MSRRAAVAAIKPQASVPAPAVEHAIATDPLKGGCPRCGYGSTAEVAPAVAAPQVPDVLRWRVVKGGTFAQNGSMVKLATGHVVALAAYGRDGIERMKARGITLEPIG